MNAPQPRIPVRYVGLEKHWRDHLYGSNVGFTRGKVSPVPAWAASQLLKHPEFEDGRPAKERGPILAPRPRNPEEDKELDEIDSHIRLDTMTKDQMAAYARRAFGVQIDTTDLKVDVVQTVRELARSRRTL
jgi:hypothetical protein